MQADLGINTELERPFNNPICARFRSPTFSLHSSYEETQVSNHSSLENNDTISLYLFSIHDNAWWIRRILNIILSTGNVTGIELLKTGEKC